MPFNMSYCHLLLFMLLFFFLCVAMLAHFTDLKCTYIDDGVICIGKADYTRSKHTSSVCFTV